MLRVQDVKASLHKEVKAVLDDVFVDGRAPTTEDYATAVVTCLLYPATAALLSIADDLQERDEDMRLEDAGVDAALRRLLRP